MQTLSNNFENQLLVHCKRGQPKNPKPPDMYTNVTEWCKKESCWEGIKELPMRLDKDLLDEFLDSDEVIDREKVAQRTQKIDSGIESQKYVIEKGADYWKEVSHYLG